MSFSSNVAGVFAGRQNDRHDRKPITAGEVHVALIAGRAAENGAGAVLHQDEVRDVNGKLPVLVERMDGANAGIESALFSGLDFGDGRSQPAAFLAEGFELRIVCGRRLGERMISRDRQERRAEKRVGPCRIDLEFVETFGRGLFVQCPANQHAVRAADPVRLHQAHLFRPIDQRIEIAQQLFGVVGDLEEPLRQLALLDERAGAPATAVDHLLVCEYGVINRVPIDLRGLAIGEAFFEQV